MPDGSELHMDDNICDNAAVQCSAIRSWILQGGRTFQWLRPTIHSTIAILTAQTGLRVRFPFEYEGATHWGCIPEEDDQRAFAALRISTLVTAPFVRRAPSHVP